MQIFTEETRPAGAKTVAELSREYGHGAETFRNQLRTVQKAEPIGRLNHRALFGVDDVIKAVAVVIKKVTRRKHTRINRTKGALPLETVPVMPVESAAEEYTTEPAQAELPLDRPDMVTAVMTLAMSVQSLASAIRERGIRF